MSDEGGVARRKRLAATRIYLIDSAGAGTRDVVRRALATGLVGMLQWRDKSLEDAPFVREARELGRIASDQGVLLVLNDRVHLVEAADADGAHVGADDLAPEAARHLLGTERLLGLSTHDPDEVARARARGADHVGLGPCFETSSKRLDRAPGGGALVARCLPAASGLPVFPIGGITPENAPTLVAAGARRLAVGAGVLAAADPAEAVRRLYGMLAESG